jgi:hypothetical protein
MALLLLSLSPSGWTQSDMVRHANELKARPRHVVPRCALLRASKDGHGHGAGPLPSFEAGLRPAPQDDVVGRQRPVKRALHQVA